MNPNLTLQIAKTRARERAALTEAHHFAVDAERSGVQRRVALVGIALIRQAGRRSGRSLRSSASRSPRERKY
jgi:hypothetical protein